MSANIFLSTDNEETRVGAAFVLVQDEALLEFVLNSTEVPSNVKY